jgi:RHS repeat-associated protein
MVYTGALFPGITHIVFTPMSTAPALLFIQYGGYTPDNIVIDGVTLDSIVLTPMNVVSQIASDDQYHYGFNGQMKVNEWAGVGNHIDFGARGYDPRTARWLTIVPMAHSFPGWSPYVFAFDNPIMNIDRGGLWGEDARGKFYDQMGTAAIKAMGDKGINNKYKALYVLSQYRNENGFNLTPPNNNPFNIKGTGDAGAVSYMTTEYINGKPVKMTQSFANFSSVQAGFVGYLDLLQSNFPDAYSALTDNDKTIVDFAKGLMSGRLGTYATAPNYDGILSAMLTGVLNDYGADLNKQLTQVNNELKGYAGEKCELNPANPDEFNKKAELLAKQKQLSDDLAKLKDFQDQQKPKDDDGKRDGK